MLIKKFDVAPGSKEGNEPCPGLTITTTSLKKDENKNQNKIYFWKITFALYRLWNKNVFFFFFKKIIPEYKIIH